MDKITIKNLKLFAYHGVNPEEKENGQNFYLDIDYYVNIANACKNDNLDDTVSYAKVVKVVRKAFTDEKYDLIERASQVVADAILDINLFCTWVNYFEPFSFVVGVGERGERFGLFIDVAENIVQ